MKDYNKIIRHFIGECEEPNKMLCIRDQPRNHYIGIFFDDALINDEQSHLCFLLRFISNYLQAVGDNIGDIGDKIIGASKEELF